MQKGVLLLAQPQGDPHPKQPTPEDVIPETDDWRSNVVDKLSVHEDPGPRPEGYYVPPQKEDTSRKTDFGGMLRKVRAAQAAGALSLDSYMYEEDYRDTETPRRKWREDKRCREILMES